MGHHGGSQDSDHQNSYSTFVDSDQGDHGARQLAMANTLLYNLVCHRIWKLPESLRLALMNEQFGDREIQMNSPRT